MEDTSKLNRRSFLGCLAFLGLIVPKPKSGVPMSSVVMPNWQPSGCIGRLMRSMKKYGLAVPVQIQFCRCCNRYGVINGKQRMIAATRLGWKQVPCMIVEDQNRQLVVLETSTINMEA